VTLAYLPSLEGVKLRVSARSRDAGLAAREIDRVTGYILERAGSYVFSVIGESLEQAVGRLLKASGSTLAVAESCTGGRVLDRLTNVPGSSAYIRGGVVAYCNSVKENVLDVSSESLGSVGAVSEEVAIQMARSIREKLGSTFGLSSTGVLGPAGGSTEKPVGTVWLGISDEAGEQSRLLKLGTDRESNKRRAVAGALDLVRHRLSELGFADLS
jgi:nicotinamide-nucleotide amidase